MAIHCAFLHALHANTIRLVRAIETVDLVPIWAVNDYGVHRAVANGRNKQLFG